MTVKRSSIKSHEQVYYCTRVHSFYKNWTFWDEQDCTPLMDITRKEHIVFGVIRNGLFLYVEDS